MLSSTCNESIEAAEKLVKCFSIKHGILQKEGDAKFFVRIREDALPLLLALGMSCQSLNNLLLGIISAEHESLKHLKKILLGKLLMMLKLEEKNKTDDSSPINPITAYALDIFFDFYLVRTIVEKINSRR